MTHSKRIHLLPYLVFTLAATFYLYEYVLQVSPSVMTTDLMAAFGVDAAGLGLMQAFYFYAYAPMQIPAGLLFDRFGPRKLITVALLSCSLGAIFFGATSSLAMASAGRFFMGIGSAFSFVGVLVLVSRWFPPQRFAFLAGIAQLMSSLGAIAGQSPVALLVEQVGWRMSCFYLAAIGIVLGAAVWLVVRDYPESNPPPVSTNDHNEWQKLKVICKKSQTWFVGLYTFSVWGPIAVFAVFWAVPYLMSLYHFSAASAGLAIMMIWLGIGFGSPFLGWFTDYIGRRCVPLAMAAAIGLVSTSIILFIPNLSLTTMYILLFFFGFAAGGQTVSFAVVKENNTHDYVGTACGFNNMATLLGGALFNPLVGYILRYEWNGNLVNGVPFYTAQNYEHALLIIPLCYLTALISSVFFIKETYCKSRVGT